MNWFLAQNPQPVKVNNVVVLWVFRMESGSEHNSLVLKRQQEKE